MSSRKNALLAKLIPVLALLTLTIPGAVCQLNSNTASVALRATLGESLTVAATPATVTIPLVSGGTAAGTSPVAITTTWVLSGSRTAVTLVGFFSSATAALTNGATTPANIPAARGHLYGNALPAGTNVVMRRDDGYQSAHSWHFSALEGTVQKPFLLLAKNGT